MTYIIQLEGIGKTFLSEKNREVEALQDIHLEIQDHEFVCLVGPSGSGKSTLLRIMEGLSRPTRGTVEVLGQSLSQPMAETGMVFQEYSLLPWRTIIDNVAFGLEVRGMAKKERYEIAHEYLRKFGLEGFHDSLPHELSGGMRQRAAIARTMATSPKILYMDEPFGALDAMTRTEMQRELIEFWLTDRRTVIFVTHSVEEAIFLGTRVVVLSKRPGRVIGDFPIDLPYPRDQWTREFGDYVHLIRDLL